MDNTNYLNVLSFQFHNVQLSDASKLFLTYLAFSSEI